MWPLLCLVKVVKLYQTVLSSCREYFTESPTIEEFGYNVKMSKSEIENLRIILVSVEQGDLGILHSLGIQVLSKKST